MATYMPDEEIYKICPYDSNHKIAPKKFNTHVAKCAQRSTKKLKMCPFNSEHRIEEVLFDAHLVECADANPIALQNWKKEQQEWEKIDQEIKKSEVDELAGRMRAVDVAGPSNQHVRVQQTWDSDWNTAPVSSGYVVPGLEDSNIEATSAHGENNFLRQLMKPSEKRKLDKKLAQETLERQKEKEMAPILAAQAEKERIEREKREKEKKEEQEYYEAMKKERERISAEKAAKKKAAKEKKKAEKRAAFFAKQAEEQAAA